MGIQIIDKEKKKSLLASLEIVKIITM